MKTLVNSIANHGGFEDSLQLLHSTIHVKQIKFTMTTTGFLTAFATVLEKFLGIESVVLLGIILLFGVELYTGIKAAPVFKSKKLPRGFVKLFIYLIMIGCTHLFAIHLPNKSIFGININPYSFIHFAFLNFTIINMLISILENCIALGWDEYAPLIKRLGKLLKLYTDE